MPRIVITGSHGVGKTTLCNDVIKALHAQDIPAVIGPEPIRVVEPRRRDEPAIAHRLRMLTEHFRRLSLGEDQICLYDRSLLDMLVYGRLKQAQPDAMEALLLELLNWYQHFIDLFLFIPIEFELPPDPDSPLINAARAPMEAAMRKAALEAGITLTDVRGDPETRTRQVLEHVRVLMGW